jgi:hypothetical protein
MNRVFVGYDPRQPLAYNVLQHSIHRHASKPVAVTPLILKQLPLKRRGLTEFTYSRFIVPYLCNYEGSALFMDADIAVTGDINELFAYADGSSVQVMQEQPKFEWASVMLFDNAECKTLTLDYVEDEANALFDLSWGSVGHLPPEWNHCVGYAEPKASHLYHYTQGLPCWHETRGLPEDSAWLDEYKELGRTVSWRELMGNSVHAKPVLKRMLRRYGIE